MRIFITGATGYIGAAVARAAHNAGHEVIALAHSAEVRDALAQKGFTPADGNLAAPSTLVQHLEHVDAVIHAGFVGGPDGAEIDRTATEAMVTSLTGSPRPFVYTSGVWVLGQTDSRTDTPADEASPLAPIPLVAWRALLEQRLVEAAQQGAATIIVRPGVAFGHGGGIPGNIARGALPLVNDGRQRWSVVHVDDLAELYLAALQARPGTVLHGVGAVLPALELVRGESMHESKREFMRECVGKTLATPDVRFVTLDSARLTLGDFADALALDQNVSAEATRSRVGWNPSRLPAMAEHRTWEHASV